MSNKRDLKAFVRFDGSGRIVAGSLILRKQKPKVGKWKEIYNYQCCNGEVLLTYFVNDPFPFVGINFEVFCPEGSFLYRNINETANSIQELVSILNANLSIFGFFAVSANGLFVEFTVKPDLAKQMNCNQDLQFNVTPA